MKKILLILPFLLFLSCSKDDESAEESLGKKLAKVEYTLEGGEGGKSKQIQEYNWDGNKVVSINTTSYYGESESIYDRVSAQMSYSDNKLSSIRAYYKNEKNNESYVDDYNFSYGDGYVIIKENGFEKYKFYLNSNNKITKIEEERNDWKIVTYISEFEYENDNVIKIKDSQIGKDSKGEGIDITDYTFDDKKNPYYGDLNFELILYIIIIYNPEYLELFYSSDYVSKNNMISENHYYADEDFYETSKYQCIYDGDYIISKQEFGGGRSYNFTYTE